MRACVRMSVWVSVPHWLAYIQSFQRPMFFSFAMHRHTIWVFVGSSISSRCIFECIFWIAANSTKCNFEFGVASIMPYFSFNMIFLLYWNFELCQRWKTVPCMHSVHIIIYSIDRSFVHSLNHTLTFDLHTSHTFFNMSTACLIRFFFCLSWWRQRATVISDWSVFYEM